MPHKPGFVVPESTELLLGILKLKELSIPTRTAIEEIFPMLRPEYGTQAGELGSGIMRIIQEEMPYYLFESIDKKDSIVKIIGEIVEEAESS